MANQVDSIWRQYPGLHGFCLAHRNAGILGQKLAALASKEFGIRVTRPSLNDHLSRCGGECADPVKQIVTPPGGFAKDAAPPRKPAPHPKGWEPHVEERGDIATAISEPISDPNPDETRLIEGWGFDPKEWRIVGQINCRRWQAQTPIIEEGKCVGYEQKWLHYFKANLERIDPVRDGQIANLIEEIARHKPTKKALPTGEDAFVVCISDIQIGKSDGDGVEGTVQRLYDGIDAVPRRISELRRIGRSVGSLYVACLGDLIESCDGHYAQQAFRAKLNRRDQRKVMRRLLLSALEHWSPLFERVVVAAVGGNHGENRREGKSFTDFADNDDVAIPEEVSEILAQNPDRYGHVSFLIPNESLTVTFDAAGASIGLAHGHQTARSPRRKRETIKPSGAQILNWWQAQALGDQPIGSVDVLLTGHYHHFLAQDFGARIHLQAPSLDGGSEWWRNQTGEESKPGMLTMVAGAKYPRKIRDLEIL